MLWSHQHLKLGWTSSKPHPPHIAMLAAWVCRSYPASIVHSIAKKHPSQFTAMQKHAKHARGLQTGARICHAGTVGAILFGLQTAQVMKSPSAPEQELQNPELRGLTPLACVKSRGVLPCGSRPRHTALHNAAGVITSPSASSKQTCI